MSQKKTIALLALIVAVAHSSAFAANFSSLRGSGLLTEGLSFFGTKSERIDDSYFNTLDTIISESGAVKTYGLSASAALIKQEDDEFARPLQKGRMSSGFGSRLHPILNRRIYHTGIDIAAPKGTPIYCSKAGKVSYSGWKTGYGYIIIIEHPNQFQTTYAHCSKLNVKVGQAVNVGQIIGLVGRTGVATGSHLHFEIRKNGKPLNPAKFVRY
jgi:murein DD-endopeptidase MepM/ murein hydrolase activator NlpD